MKILDKHFSSCLVFLIIINCIASDNALTTTDVKWTCTCLSMGQMPHSNITASNCSSSCDCKHAGRSQGGIWMCNCPHDGLPLLSDGNSNADCFTGCNCTSGSLTDAVNSREHISGKTVVIVLLICVVFTTLAFAASILCYLHQREKYQSAPPLSDGGSSYNSGTNLISYRSNPRPESGLCLFFLPGSFAGWLDKISPPSSRNAARIHGTIIRFSYSELEHATNKFSITNLIGSGASSYVYRGYLKDGRAVAVKRLKIPGNDDTDSVFLTEMALISRLHHCHLVPLVGYCLECVGKQTERLLIFEFMSNGNLRECLDGTSKKFLDWNTRVAIALGAARGLEYLHEAAAPRILHRDVKSTNILLDDKWRPKITDLGMSKHLGNDDISSCSSSPARMQGTFGYLAPEYAIIGKASLKSDVFSFGVVLLELITGRAPIYSSSVKGGESLVLWAAPRLQNSTCVISELADPKLRGKFPEEELRIMACLAKECLLLDPDSRPSMSEVVQILLTVAPELSNRRNFTMNLLQQKLPGDIMKDGPDMKGLQHQVNIRVDSKDLKKEVSPSRWSLQHSLHLKFSHMDSLNKSSRQGDVSSSEEKALASRDKICRTCHDEEDEIIDLMEPQLKSFSMHSDGSC